MGVRNNGWKGEMKRDRRGIEEGWTRDGRGIRNDRRNGSFVTDVVVTSFSTRADESATSM
jgi:hypothetical protein